MHCGRPSYSDHPHSVTRMALEKKRYCLPTRYLYCGVSPASYADCYTKKISETPWNLRSRHDCSRSREQKKIIDDPPSEELSWRGVVANSSRCRKSLIIYLHGFILYLWNVLRIFCVNYLNGRFSFFHYLCLTDNNN